MRPINVNVAFGKGTNFPLLLKQYIINSSPSGFQAKHFSMRHADWKVALLPTKVIQPWPEVVCGCGHRNIDTSRRNFTTCNVMEQKVKRKETPQSQSLTESRNTGAVTLSLGEKVKENAKTGVYGGVILVGIAVSGAMLYVLLSELFSSNSPNNIYTHSFKLCKLSLEVQDALGAPIKCYGEETRRGWRRHVAHSESFEGNVKCIRMRYYIEGPFRKGTVHVEKKMNDRGNYEYAYVIVDVDGYPPRRINVNF